MKYLPMQHSHNQKASRKSAKAQSMLFATSLHFGAFARNFSSRSCGKIPVATKITAVSRIKTTLLSLVMVLLMANAPLAREQVTTLDWPMFRGTGGRSVGQADLPIQWSITDGQGVAWQADLPGRGVSGPIVVGGKVFVTASSGPDRDRLHVLALDANTGQLLWHRRFWATGKSQCHATSANAAPTPASDGQRVFAFFSSNDMIALDLDGNLLWMRALTLDYPGAGNALGMSSSPIVVGDVVVVQSEAQGNSFVAALDRKNGATRWDLQRPLASNWCSPIAVDAAYSAGGQPAVVLQSGEGISVHRADNGEACWQTDLVCESIPSLTFDNKYLYAPASGVQVFDLLAGDQEEKVEPVWKTSKLQPGSPSPVVASGQVFVISRGGVLNGGALDNEKVWKLRLGGRFWATPVLVGKHLYCINADGKCSVVELGEPGKKGKVVGENEFGEEVLSSPAVGENGLYVRSHAHLWKIAK